MRETHSSPIEQFAQRLDSSLRDRTFGRLILSGARPGQGLPDKILARAVDLKGKPHLSLTLRFPTRDEVRNVPVEGAVAWVLQRLGAEFRSALLSTTVRDWQLSLPAGKKPRLVRHKASTTAPPARAHDQVRQGILDASARDWLTGLGVLDRKGEIRPAMAAKFTQINRYLEIFSHLAKDVGWIGSPSAASPSVMVDMGCGKGYLTFALWHFWRRIQQLPVRVIGVEVRPELVAEASRLAASAGATELEFMAGTIEGVTLPKLDALIALHACDTATDDALRRGIDAGARLIVVAPCCHQQVRPQLGAPQPLSGVLRHGLMAERMAEWATDGLRALFLEWAGYATKMIEFVSVEHTAKNLMIAAVRATPPFADPTARRRIEELKSFFGVSHHPLDPLLARTPSGGDHGS